MKLSIIGITANPTEKQYAWKEALASYVDLADEVIIVNGGTEFLNFEGVIEIMKPDPEVWNWAEHAKNLNIALAAATGDWILKVDLDWVFHEKDIAKLRRKLSSSEARAFEVATMQKMTFYPTLRYIQKGQIPVIINSDFKDDVQFGRDFEYYTDLTYPIRLLRDRKKDEHGVPIGHFVGERDWAKTGVEFWNFDYTFSTRENMQKKWLRMSRSHKTYFGNTRWGDSEEEAEAHFIRNMKGKIEKSIPLKNPEQLPSYIRKRILDIKYEEFGHSCWGLL